MIVRVATDLSVTLDQPEDLRRFKVVVEHGVAEPDAAAALAEVGWLQDRDCAWILQDALRRLGPDDQAWRAGLTAMVDKARPHGWIDDEKQAIRAHVEWPA